MHADARPEDQAKLDSLQKQVGQLNQAGKFAEAIPIAEDSLKLAEKAFGPNHPQTALWLNNLAELYNSMGHYSEAEPLLQRALTIEEDAFGSDSPSAARILQNLGNLYRTKSDYAKAEPLLERALKIFEKDWGPSHANSAHAAAAIVLNDLSAIYVETGDYPKAVLALERSLKMLEEALGPDHPRTGMTLNNLAEVYRLMGVFAKAEPLYQRALQIDERALGPDHPDTALVLNNIAMLHQSMGDYAKAEPLLQRALKTYEKALGPDHPKVGTTFNNLAELYRSIGDYAKAAPLSKRALDIYERALGPDHPEVGVIVNNLAMLHHLEGHYAQAVSLYERMIKIEEKHFGPNHPKVAGGLSNLAMLHEEQEEYAKAEPLLKRALAIYEKAMGLHHPDTGTILNNLAHLYNSMGDYAKAEPLYQRALKIREKALGPDHQDTANTLNNLAFLKIDLGEAKEAVPLIAQARQAEERSLSNILSFTSEQQRLAFQKTTRPYTLLATLGNAAELAERVLRQKGVVLDSLVEDRLVAEASNDPKQREIIEQLRAAKQRLMQLVLEVPKDLSESAQKRRAVEKARLSGEVEQLEAGLARQVAGLGKARRALSVTVAQVQSALPKQATLVELLHYDHYHGKNKWELSYGAIVIAPAGEPKWVPLGSAAEIEKSIKLYRKSARGETNEATLSTVLKKLQEQVWAPVERALPAGTTTVIVSPDAELSFVSFATLLTPDDRFLSEKYSIHYMASGRDLLRETKTAEGSKTTMRVFANPDFATNEDRVALVKEETRKVALRSIEMRDLQSILLPNLPGTEKEAKQLEERANKAGWQTQGSMGPNATEAELRKVNSPRVLHLATHGFFLPEIDLGAPRNGFSRTEADIPKGKLLNPMHRSGIAVAGAQTTLHAWAKGEVFPTENDGIVTAEEVGGLKLNDTWLVVLSACDTGSGEAKAGEGVMGLRRGFVQAGTQNLLMTLWPISDETTVNIMLNFYDAAFKTGNAPQALADTQRDWLVKLRKEIGLLAAVRLAGPFIMSSQGKP